MLRSALLPILVAVSCCAAAGCARAPSAYVEGHPIDGPRPAQWLLRCSADGFRAPVKLQWRVAAGVRILGNAVPLDEAALLVQPPERGASWAECAAVGADGVVVRAIHSLVSPTVGVAPTVAKVGELLTVRGAGFGPEPNAGDALWLVPAWGHALAADRACKGASWNDAEVRACVPAAARGRSWQLRVQAADTLAIAAKPLVVAP